MVAISPTNGSAPSAQPVRNLDTIAGRGLVPVAHSKGSANIILQLSDGVLTSATYEMPIKIAGDCSDLSILWTGRGNKFHALDDAFRVKLTIRKTVGATTHSIPLTWSGGERLKTINPGAVAVTAPCATDFTANETVLLRIYVEVDSGKRWPMRMSAGAGVSWQNNTDQADTAATLSNTGGYAMAPDAILGHAKTGIASMTVYGDSRAENPDPFAGITDTVPVLDQAVATERGHDDFLRNPLNQAERRNVGDHGLNVFWEYGINDMYPVDGSERTAAQVLGDLAGFCVEQARRGVAVWAATIPPYTTSTDGFATVANQTPYNPSANTQRVAFNNALRDGAPYDIATKAFVATGSTGPGIIRAGAAGHPLAYPGCPAAPGCSHPGYFELADLVESARDSGKWKAGGLTGDGLHASAAGNDALKPAFSASVLRKT